MDLFKLWQEYYERIGKRCIRIKERDKTLLKENKHDIKYVIIDEYIGLNEKQIEHVWKTFKTLKK